VTTFVFDSVLVVCSFEEGRKQVFQILLRNPDSLVSHLDPHCYVPLMVI